ncbi:RNA-directed DNA polymerase, eukaryota, reverse transcriptase zinc-binding domain protein [Tanacetum coccineum]
MEVFINGVPRSIEGNVTASKPQTLEEAINIAQRLMDQIIKHDSVQEANDHKRNLKDKGNIINNNYQNKYSNNNNNNDHHQQQNKKQETFKTYTATNGYIGNRPLCERLMNNDSLRSEWRSRSVVIEKFAARSDMDSKRAELVQAFSKEDVKWDSSFPPGTNSLFFTLIPKVSNPLYIKDFRPISLTGFQYKIVAKITGFPRRIEARRPLSPFLSTHSYGSAFHIALLEGLVVVNLFQGVKIRSSEIRLSHLFYADDVIILSKWNQCDMDNIIRILNVFYLASGLKINISKSNLYGVGVSSIDIESMPAGGRLTLIKSSWEHWRSIASPIFKVREDVLKTLESLRALFFSGATGDSRKLAWIKWSNILASLEKGGLGVKVLKLIHGNEAGIELKGCQTNGLWARIVGTIYHLHSSGYVPLNSLRYQVISPRKESKLPIRDRIVNGLWAWDWRRPVNGGRAFADLNNLLIDIGLLNVEVDRDCVVSSLSTDGSYSVSFIRKYIDNCMIANSLPSTRWCKIIPRKVNIFMWRLLLDRLPHRLNLSSCGLDIDSILCPVCSEHVESNSHAFFSCSAASNIWRLVRGWCDLKIPTLSSCDEWDIWYTSWKASKVEKDRAYVIFAAACWMLWRFRNNHIFNSQDMRKCEVFDNI